MKMINKIAGFVLVIGSICNPYIIKGQTQLSGVIGVDSTLWLANSPYQVIGNLVVMPNVTLTVEPGVIVKFNSNIELLLRGKLIANGTLMDTITFTSDIQNPSSWVGITIDNYANAKVECSYFKAKYSDDLFRNHKTIGTDTTLKLTNCVLDSNNRVIVNWSYSNNYTKHYYDSCIFSNNGGVNGTAWGSTFKNSLVYGGNRGIENDNNSPLGSIVDNCVLHDLTYSTLSGNLTITNCTIYNNAIGVGASSYGPTLHFNNIYQNTIGIFSWNTSINPSGQITQNRICNNATNISLQYAADFNVINNCWCLNDSAQIRSTINDFFAQAGLGIVNFTPFDTTCSFLTSDESLDKDKFDVTLFPNPVSSKLTLKFSNHTEEVQLRFVNVFGIVENHLDATYPETNIDVDSFAKGIYILEITSRSKMQRLKFIKQ